MKWKVILAVIVILGIAGLLLATDVGQNYADFLRKSVGNFISVIIRRQSSGPMFGIELTANKDSLYGQTYNMANSTFEGSGFYQKIKVGDSDVTIKSGDDVDVLIGNFNGVFEYTVDGMVKIAGSSNHIEINDLAYSSAKANKFQLEMVPFTFTLSNVVQDKITLKMAYGEVKTDRGQAPLEGSKLDVNFFVGDLRLDSDGNVNLLGITNSVIGDKFSFT
ncbi:MAG TPA: hypothetical protein VJ343_02295 [archaeon]|nr:hypothetical protein [archaeon]